jgi:hypothetical protein
MERKLASIQTILNLQPIEGADRIETATILGWSCVVKRDEFSIGQSVVYIETDSLLPPLECFDFMQPRHYRVRIAKFKKQISQGLVMPITILPPGKYNEGQDVTEILQIHKHDPQGDKEKRLQEQLETINKNRVDKFFKRYKWYRNFFKKIPKGFPHFIKKTDEDRIQLFPRICEQEKGTVFSVTSKLDGTSATFALIRTEGRRWWNKFLLPKYTFVVCSRNLHLKKPNGSFYWEMAIKKDMKSILQRLIGTEKFVILQGEIMGEGIQGNKLKLKEREFYAFNLIYPNYQLNNEDAKKVLGRYDIKFVPILPDLILKDSIPECVELAKGKSLLNKDMLREGIVLRNYKKGLSFKIINPDFLLKYDE